MHSHKTPWTRVLASIGSAIAAVLLLVVFSPQTYAAGEGTATINIGTGGTNASDATYGGAGASGSVTVGTKSYVRLDLTVGASHINSGEDNVTVQINTNLFPANSFETQEEAALADLDTVGEWIVTYTDVSATTDNSLIDLTTNVDAVNTGLITIQADQQMDATDIIHIYAVVQDITNLLAAANVVIQTDDTGANDLTTIGTPPTIATAAADATATVALGTNSVVGAAGSTTVTLTVPFALDADDTIDITFPAFVNISAIDSATTGTFDDGGGTITCADAGSQVVTCTTDGVTSTTGTIIMTGITTSYVGTTDITDLAVENEGGAGADVAADTSVALTDVTAADAAASLALANPSLGVVTNGTLTLTLPINLAASDTIVFTAPSSLDVSLVAFSSETFSGAGTFSSCSASGQVITCTSGGAITAGTGTIVMTGFSPTSTGSSTITSLAVNDVSASGADMAADSSGAITEVSANTSDNDAPEVPSNIQISSTNGQVVITWTDPSDSDLSIVEILRGLDPYPVTAAVYGAVNKGVETYTDTEVAAGDIAKYILRAKDSSGNFSDSDEYSITVSANETASSATVTTTTTTTTTTTPTTTVTTTTPSDAGVTQAEIDETVSTFSDLIESAWHTPFITRMKKLGILAGYPDGTVKPDRTINRAELAKIAAKAFNLSNATETFTDVPNDSWYAPFVGALQQAGASWTTGSEYKPDEGVTRGEAIWVLLKAAGIDLDNVTVSKLFPDVNTKHRYAAAIVHAYNAGIINGYENGNFGPGDTLTRAQVAKIVTLIKDMLK